MKKVLVVEDEKHYRELLKEKIEGAGYETVLAQNGLEALEQVKAQGDISLIILDLLMPQMDGVTFFYRLKKELNSSIPTIILTNLADTAYPADADIRDFIVKASTSLDEVIQKIKKITE